MEELVANYGIIFGYIIFGVAGLAALTFPIIHLIKDKDFKKVAIAALSIVGLVVFYMLCYILAKNEPFALGEIYHSGEQMKFVEACLFLGYATFVFSILAIIYSSVSRYLR